jgi:hypothetical protein
MAVVGPILTAVGAVVSAAGSIMAGNAQAAQQKFQAQQLDMKAKEERAGATRQAADQAKQQDLIISRQRALAAASGGSATDPTILDLMGDTAAQGYVQQQTTLGMGENQARGYEDAAASARASAKSARMAGYIGAGSSLLSGLGSAFDNYAKGVKGMGGYGGGMPYQTPGGGDAASSSWWQW